MDLLLSTIKEAPPKIRRVAFLLLPLPPAGRKIPPRFSSRGQLAPHGAPHSLVVHLEDPTGGLGELLLFVSPAAGHVFDDEARATLVRDLRSALSPRHVPDEIVAVTTVPRTLSGKRLEIPVKKILQGVDPDVAASRGALKDPTSLAEYVALAERRRDTTRE